MRARMTRQMPVGGARSLKAAAAAMVVVGTSSSLSVVSAFTSARSAGSVRPLHSAGRDAAANAPFSATATATAAATRSNLRMSSIERKEPPTESSDTTTPSTSSSSGEMTTNEISSGLQKGGRGDGGKGKFRFDFRDILPPEPEDQLAMSGDIIALFVYAFLDHFLNEMMASALVSGDSVTAAAIDPETATTLAMSTKVPVWWDVTQHTLPVGGAPVLPALGYVPYAPAISTAGASAVILVSAWLVSGYFTGAFLYKNTLQCSVSKAVATAGRTWISATVITVGIALASDAWCDCVANPSLGGLTKADADFLFGSLSVLTMWRFVLGSILGSGGNDD